MLMMLSELLDGTLPSIQDVLYVQSAILESLDIYQPIGDRGASCWGQGHHCLARHASLTRACRRLHRAEQAAAGDLEARCEHTSPAACCCLHGLLCCCLPLV
jgi:hypothetical protein